MTVLFVPGISKPSRSKSLARNSSCCRVADTSRTKNVPTRYSRTYSSFLIPFHKMNNILTPGELAPDFEIDDLNARRIRLSTLRGQPVLLYFLRGFM